MIPKFNEYKERWEVESRNTIEPGLDRMIEALEKVGDPHKNLNIIHVAGTNGKGSTIAMMEAMLSEHGLKTACFYSPCFFDVHDQIQLNGRYISETQLDQLFTRVKQAGLSGFLTDFELLTVLAFMAFEEFKADIVLLEAGMGGRFDSTNVVTPLLSIIPSIAIEHEQFLGTTLREVAYHKAGIIKQGVPVIIGNLDDESLNVMKEECVKQKTTCWIESKDFKLKQVVYRDFEGNQLDRIHIGLKGQHQLLNGAIAIRAIFYLLKLKNKTVDETKIRDALLNVSLQGRFEKINNQLILDGAHNPASIRVLVDTIKKEFPNDPIHFFVGLIKGKNAVEILNILEEIDAKFTFVDFPDERAMSAQNLLNLSNATYKSGTKDPLGEIEKIFSENSKIIVTGSLYLLANFRKKALKMFKNI